MKVIHRNSPKAGQVEHLQPHTAQLLADAGLCEIIPYKDFRERLAEESSPAAKPTPVEWGIRESDGSPFSVNVVVKKTATGMQFLSQPPDDAPASIKCRFAELTTRDPNANAAAIAKAKSDLAQYNERLKNAKLY